MVRKKSRLSARKKYSSRPCRAGILPKPKIQSVVEHYDSDQFFVDLFDNTEFESYIVNETLSLENDNSCDSDGLEADEFYVVLDKVYQYYPHDDLDQFVKSETSRLYSKLRFKCQEEITDDSFMYVKSSEEIKFIQLYDSDHVSEAPRVKICVGIGKDFRLKIQVHGQSLPEFHPVWDTIGRTCYEARKFNHIITEIGKYEICQGNKDKDIQDLVPVGAFLDVANGQKCLAFREYWYIGSVIRSTSCCLLINRRSERCDKCKTYRKTLKKTQHRRVSSENIPTPKKNWLNSRVPNKLLSENQKLHKLKQMKNYTLELEQEISRLRREVKQKITSEGIQFDNDTCSDFENIMESSKEEIRKAYPDEQSYQRLFWEEQLKFSKLKDKRGMRWHPMVVKWCIFLKSKSSSTYDALKNSGFIRLPSERTLHDYTSLVTKGTGFQPDIISNLTEETKGFTGHQRIVGILQDEIRIKSDLVYNKHSGELIGFVDLGNMNNDLLRLYENEQNPSLAKYVLVLMVRGVSSNLKYPLAHFATNGVTSDQLFCLLWQGVEILEVDVGLDVLFITSDGASPNRRFIKLHKDGEENENSVIYRAKNIFSPTSRWIYFVSDAPHLIKTTRNCFSNSFSHKKTRKMWKNGYDISWIQIVDLYKDHCSGLYSLCNKLTRKHIDITSFGAMKVKLAAQVLSSTVANALELKYGDQVQETVKFIRHIDKFFDCLNSRNLSEASRKRNDNTKAFTSCDDPRLDYLVGDFLYFFSDWKLSVVQRNGNFSKSEKSGMMLSYQTLEGLEISAKSVVSLVRYCLLMGMDFVLTEKFNQDPIEQHFGVHRSSQGCNNNPNLSDFSNAIVKIRTVGSQAIAPFRGNTRRRLELPPVDSTPLPKKKKQNRA